MKTVTCSQSSAVIFEWPEETRSHSSAPHLADSGHWGPCSSPAMLFLTCGHLRGLSSSLPGSNCIVRFITKYWDVMLNNGLWWLGACNTGLSISDLNGCPGSVSCWGHWRCLGSLAGLCHLLPHPASRKNQTRTVLLTEWNPVKI